MKKNIIFILSMATVLTANVVEIKNIAEFQEYIRKNNKIVVKFFAPWCGVCQGVEHPYQEISKEKCYKGITFAAVNVDEQKELAIQNNVSGLPTFVYFENGVKKNESVGVRSMQTFKEDFRKELNTTFNIASGADNEVDISTSAVEEKNGSNAQNSSAEHQKSNDIFAQFTDLLRRIFHFISDLIMNIFNGIKNLFGIA